MHKGSGASRAGDPRTLHSAGLDAASARGSLSATRRIEDALSQVSSEEVWTDAGTGGQAAKVFASILQMSAASKAKQWNAHASSKSSEAASFGQAKRGTIFEVAHAISCIREMQKHAGSCGRFSARSSANTLLAGVLASGMSTFASVIARQN